MTDNSLRYFALKNLLTINRAWNSDDLQRSAIHAKDPDLAISIEPPSKRCY
jgi:hypothetical protein